MLIKDTAGAKFLAALQVLCIADTGFDSDKPAAPCDHMLLQPFPFGTPLPDVLNKEDQA